MKDMECFADDFGKGDLRKTCKQSGNMNSLYYKGTSSPGSESGQEGDQLEGYGRLIKLGEIFIVRI